MDEDYEDEYEGEDESNDAIQWRTLNTKERLELMKNIFTNEDWYDGTPFAEGGMAMHDGSHNPDFQAVVDKSGAPMKEVKRYYAAWLKRQGLDPKTALSGSQGSSSMSAVPSAQHNVNSHHSPQGQNSMLTPAMDMGPDPMEQMMASRMQGSDNRKESSESNNMMFMMHFLTSQQRMQMQQQQFQAQLMMQQRQGDQQREADMRREQMARDQQFMQQQTTLLRESFKRSNDRGFEGKLMEAAQEKMIDEMIGGKEENWKDSVKEVLGSDTLKEAVAGIGGALGARRTTQIPAGYDDTQYNPYAQPLPPPQPLPPQHLGQVQPQEHLQTTMDAAVPQQMDGVFFDEPPTQQPPSPPQPPIPQEMSRDEFSKILFASFAEMLGPAMQDPQVSNAVQEQVDVSVDVVMLQMPEAIPQIKLQAMGEKMLLVRNLRDICFGLRDLRERTTPGQAPGGIVIAAVISELRKRPEFYKLFSDNSYEELLAELQPFKDTGAIRFDYEYLLRPEVAEIARHLLEAAAADKQSQGSPQ